MRIVVGITGASGAVFGIRALQVLRTLDVETHLILSKWARSTIAHETAMPLEDLEKLQFYISTNVVAQYQDPAGGAKSLLLPKLTPGVVTAAGPNWLKVSFREGGADVPFLTDLTQYDPRYFIASEIEGSNDFKMIANLRGESFIYKGTRYTLVSGDDAYLLFDWEGWKKIVETRVATQGREVGER